MDWSLLGAPAPATMPRVDLCIPEVTQAAGVTGGGCGVTIPRDGSRPTSQKLLKSG